MKRLFWVGVVAILLIGCATTRIVEGPIADVDHFRQDEVLNNMSGAKVAVLPFASTQSSIGWEYAEELSVFLGKCRRFQMIERLKVEKLFKEQDFDPNRIDDGAAVKIGKMLGATGVIVGTAGDDYVNVRLVNTETGVHAWNARYALLQKQLYALDHTDVAWRRAVAVNLVRTLKDAKIGISVSGRVITGFLPGSKAAAAGLMVGDMIEAAGGHRLNDDFDLMVATFAKKPGDKLVLIVNRKGRRFDVEVELIPLK